MHAGDPCCSFMAVGSTCLLAYTNLSPSSAYFLEHSPEAALVKTL